MRLRQFIPAVVAVAALCTLGLSTAANAQTVATARPAHATTNLMSGIHLVRGVREAKDGPETCYYMEDDAGEYVLLNSHGDRVLWLQGDGSCMGFADVGTTGGGQTVYVIGGGGQCMDAADADGFTDAVWTESCVSGGDSNEDFVDYGTVFQNVAFILNLTACYSGNGCDSQNGYVVVAGGPSSDYNNWGLTTTDP